MIRYTTPTVQLLIKDVDITRADEVYASFGQGTSTLVTKLVAKSKRSMTPTGTLLKIDMAQDETAAFSRLSECKVQVNWSTGQKRYATSVAKMAVTDNLLGNKLDLVGSTTPVYVLEPLCLTTDGVKAGELPKEWVRPSEWPNLDAYDYDTDELYMTFDGTQDDSHCAFKINGASYIVEINGQTWTQDAGSTFSYGFTEADGDYPVVHVKADGNISRFEWMAYTVDDRSYTALQNPVLERVGDVYDYGDTDAPTWGTYYLVREKVKRHACLHETLAQTWYYCNSLQSLDLSGWNTTNWNVTSLAYTWSNCSSLQSLDLSGWNTTNWNVTSLAQTWYNCSSLQSLNLSGWNTTNWNVTSLALTWYYCNSLQSLDLSGWDTASWNVTSLAYTWSNCNSLRNLNLSGWNTTNWNVTSLAQTWYNCNSLQSLDLSGWNTTNWNVTALAQTWYSCNSLRSLDLSGWNTTNWNVTELTHTWSNCNSLQSLDLSGWDTTNWNVTSLAQTWYNCNSLQSLDLSKFDMSKITALGNESYAPTSISLQDIIVGSNNYGKYAPTSCVYLSLKNSKALTHKSLIEVGKMLATVTNKHYLQLGTDLSNKLSETEKAEITAKGWTIA